MIASIHFLIAGLLVVWPLGSLYAAPGERPHDFMASATTATQFCAIQYEHGPVKVTSTFYPVEGVRFIVTRVRRLDATRYEVSCVALFNELRIRYMAPNTIFECPSDWVTLPVVEKEGTCHKLEGDDLIKMIRLAREHPRTASKDSMEIEDGANTNNAVCETIDMTHLMHRLHT